MSEKRKNQLVRRVTICLPQDIDDALGDYIEQLQKRGLMVNVSDIVRFAVAEYLRDVEEAGIRL
ncbi:MAG: hypothetical protein LAT81_16255 [Oceanicaulis sp.]|nr:hypothetical protein [Oceanicaulis sp.]